MSISPFSARPVSPEGESRRARLALVAATVGIGATLLAYGVSPGVRHAVGHAEHSVKHAVTHVFDPDAGKRLPAKGKARTARPRHAVRATHGVRATPSAAKPSAGHAHGSATQGGQTSGGATITSHSSAPAAG